MKSKLRIRNKCTAVCMTSIHAKQCRNTSGGQGDKKHDASRITDCHKTGPAVPKIVSKGGEINCTVYSTWSSSGREDLLFPFSPHTVFGQKQLIWDVELEVVTRGDGELM